MVDSDSHQFVRWSEFVPAYSAKPHNGIPSEAFVHSINTEVSGHIIYVSPTLRQNLITFFL